MPPGHGGAALPFPHILNARPVIAAVLPHSQLGKLPGNLYFGFSIFLMPPCFLQYLVKYLLVPPL